MPTQPTAGSGSFSPGDLPIDLVHNSATTISFAAGYVNTFTNAAVCVTSIDCVAKDAEPVQCFCFFERNGTAAFFYDSQSTGEGLGVYFLWRGLMVLPPGGTLEIEGHSSATILWSCSAAGIVVPAGIYS